VEQGRAAVPSVLAGKYRLGERLGEGATAQVFAATAIATGDAFAVKVLHPSLADDPIWSARFLRESRALARIQSPNVARVFEVGATDDGRPFLVMERIDGESLEAELQRKKRFAPQDVAWDLAEICAALAVVHGAAIVHRDLSLQNVIRAKTASGPVLKVVDFGLARDVADGAPASLTPAGMVVGTPYYVSPEHLQDPRGVDARADLWALGVCGYRLLTGAYPFAGETGAVVVARVLEGALTPVRTLRADVPSALATVIERCLARDPKARFEDAGAVSIALALARDDLADADRTHTSGPVLPPTRLHDVALRLAERPAPPPARRRRRRMSFRTAAALVVAIALALGALAGWLVTHH
jgi:serine/threonine-protein kinase